MSTCSDVQVVLINLCMLASTVGACQYMSSNCLVLLALGVVAIGVRTPVPRC